MLSHRRPGCSPLVLAVVLSTVTMATARLVERMAAATPLYAGEPSLPFITSMPAPYGGLFPLEKRQDSCPEGQTNCGGLCAYDCCDAAAGWRCPIQGERCYTSGGYIGCCAGDSCQSRSACYDYAASQNCDGSSGPCTACGVDSQYCVTELNTAAGFTVLYCATRSVEGTSYVAGTASRSSETDTSESSSSSSSSSSTSSSSTTSSDSSSSSQTSDTSVTVSSSTTTSSRSTSSSSTTAGATPTTLPPPDPPSRSLSGGAIAGIVIGGIGGIIGLAILGAILLFIRKRHQAATLAAPPPGRIPSDTPGGYSQPSPNVLGSGTWQQPQYHPVPTNYTEMENTQVPTWSANRPGPSFAELPDTRAGLHRY